VGAGADIVVAPAAAGGSGITQLPGDVTAGPGSGVKAATLVATANVETIISNNVAVVAAAAAAAAAQATANAALPTAGGVLTGPITGGKLYDNGGMVFNVKSAPYGALGNGKVNAVGDGHITSGLAVFTSASGAFVAGDVGKAFSVLGAGAAGATLLTTILSYQSATQVTLANAAGTTVTTSGYCYGTDDTAAIQGALNACITAGGGIVFAPPGIYLINNTGISLPNVPTHVIFMGAGETATLVKALANPPTSLFVFQCNGWTQDCTFDANFSTSASSLEMSNAAGQVTFKLNQGMFRVTCQNSDGSWIMDAWDRNQTFMIDSFFFEDVTIQGPGNPAGDNFAVSYVNRCYVNNVQFINLQRSPNFYYANTLVLNNVISTGGVSFAALVIDVGVLWATVNNLQIIPSGAATTANLTLNGTFAELTNCVVGTTTTGGVVTCNNLGTSGVGTYRMNNVHIPNGYIAIGQPIVELSFHGGFIDNLNGDAIVIDSSAATSTTSLVRFSNSSLNGFNSSQPLFRSVHAVTWTLVQVHNCDAKNFAAPGAFTNITLGGGSSISKVKGWNPVQSSSVPGTAFAIAGSTATYTNNTGLELDLYVTVIGTVTLVTINGIVTSTAGPLTLGYLGHLSPGGTLKMTYAVAPTIVAVNSF
jgi:hypothetical protein